MAISRYLIEPHLKTLWWWQRRPVLDLVTECLEYVESGDEAGVLERLDTLSGRPKLVAMLCLQDCLRYVQFAGDQFLEELKMDGPG